MVHYTKGTSSSQKLRQIVSIKFQSLFTFAKSFSLFPYGTFHYQSIRFLDFEGGPPVFEKIMTWFFLLKQKLKFYFTGLFVYLGYLLWLLLLNKMFKFSSLLLHSLATTNNVSVDLNFWLLRWFSLPDFLFKSFKQFFNN